MVRVWLRPLKLLGAAFVVLLVLRGTAQVEAATPHPSLDSGAGALGAAGTVDGNSVIFPGQGSFGFNEYHNFSIQNAGLAPATVSATWFDASGSVIDESVLAGPSERLAPGDSLEAGTPFGLRGSFRGSVVFTSDQPLVGSDVMYRAVSQGGQSSSLSAAGRTGQRVTPGSTGSVVSLPYISNQLDGTYNTRIHIANAGSATACVKVQYSFVPGQGSLGPSGKAPITDGGPGGGGCVSGYPLAPNGSMTIAPVATPGLTPFPAATVNTLMAATVTSTGSAVVAVVDAYLSNGLLKAASYEGFLVNSSPAPGAVSDLGMDLAIPVALKTADGYYSQVLMSNPNDTPAQVAVRYSDGLSTYTATLTIPAFGVANHSVYSDTVVPVGFLGSARVLSDQPIAAVIFRSKMTTAFSYDDQDLYTAVNATPVGSAAKKLFMPSTSRRALYPTGQCAVAVIPASCGKDLANTWLSITVPGGGRATVTIRTVSHALSNSVAALPEFPRNGAGFVCPGLGEFTVTRQITGSFVFYQNADSDNGFGFNPACLTGAMTITSDVPILGVSSYIDRDIDDALSGDSEANFQVLRAPSAQPTGPTTGCVPGPNEVALFEHINFGGTCLVKGIGDYANIVTAGFPNDILSSVKVGANVQLILFADVSFQGASSTYPADRPNVTGDAIGNDTASSFKVQARAATSGCQPGPNEVALFEHINFGGACLIKGIGDYANIVTAGFSNDTLSSLKVGSAVQLVLFADVNFLGLNSTYRGDAPAVDFADVRGHAVGNDTASSFKVQVRGGSTTGCEPGVNEVALFEHINFAGACLIRGSGNYANIVTAGFPNDALSSVKVGRGVQLVLFVDINFLGANSTYRGDASDRDFPDVSNHAIGNDRASSFNVAARGGSTTGCEPGVNEVALFEHINFGGSCLLKGIGDYANIVAAGFPNDTLSSAKVGSSVQLILFVDVSFLGADSTYRGDAPAADFVNVTSNAVGNDTASSFKVQARGGSTTGCEPGVNEVALFVDINFGGACLIAGLGDYANIVTAGFPNDALSSVKVGLNVEALLFVDVNFVGGPTQYLFDESNVSSDAIGNDRASSFKVQVIAKP